MWGSVVLIARQSGFIRRGCAVWSGPSLSANKIIGYFRRYEWREKLCFQKADLNLRILCMFEGIFSLDAANINGNIQDWPQSRRTSHILREALSPEQTETNKQSLTYKKKKKNTAIAVLLSRIKKKLRKGLKLNQDFVQIYTLLPNSLPWTPVPVGACYCVQGCTAKHSLSLGSSDRSPNFLARETSSPKFHVSLCSITTYLLRKHNVIIKLM